MGDVISLAELRASRTAGGLRDLARSGRSPRLTFYFDLASPWTYLAAERADRLFSTARWLPAIGDALSVGPGAADPRDDALREAAERRAIELGMPLVWPEAWPAIGRGAMRVAALAADQGRAAPFVLAASRLAFCGGYELDDPEILAEAAAAAGLRLHEALAAAGQVGRDGAMERAALRLLRNGADALPAVTVGRLVFAGEPRLAEAAAAAAAPPPERRGSSGRRG
ncbi:MAG TPA: DsbA family protein [Solirubrobacteraceae bacterium]|nr:DsbA family protein [Solirubrobacteraceae bacterium]